MSDDEIYEYMGRTFEWDRVKAVRNAVKHHVLFTEAATVFFDRQAIFEGDPDHSEDEERYIVIGQAINTGALIVAHVYRGDRTRIISARKATASERRDYEKRLGRQL